MASSDDLAKAMEALIGGNDEEATVKIYLDSGYAPMNYILSSKWDGGFPVGRIVEMAGPPSSGKTAISTAAMAAAQKMGGIAGFMDHERSFSNVLGRQLGLDTKSGRFIYKTPRTFEESLTLAVKVATHVREKKLIDRDAPICWVFDSLASMVPQSALIDQKTGKDKSAEDRNMNDNTALARATSAHFPAFAQWCHELDICAIFLNQIRLKMGVMYGDPRTTPGGEAPKFYASTRIMLGASQIKKDKDIIGSEVTAATIKNKVSRPFQKATWRFMFQPDGTGRFDVERSTIEFLEGEKILTSKRAGFVDWEGTQIGKEALARKIQEENAMPKLLALLPKAYEPPVVADVELEDAA
jgi:protein RecA